jgi:hypothetical protein
MCPAAPLGAAVACSDGPGGAGVATTGVAVASGSVVGGGDPSGATSSIFRAGGSTLLLPDAGCSIFGSPGRVETV